MIHYHPPPHITNKLKKMKKTALSIAFMGVFISACNDSNSTPAQITTPQIATITAHIKANDIKPVSTTMVRFSAPGVTASNASKVTGITANFGDVSIDQTTGDMTFKPYTSSATNVLSAEIIAAQHDYKFEISYKVDNNIHQLDGSVLPLYNDKLNNPAIRFSKVSQDGTLLSAEDQARPANASDWSCVTDKSSDLMWQAPQANGIYAFNETYYWGDRSINHRESSEASCVLDGNCNTDNLVAKANEQLLCGKSDWRLATRTEWQTLLDKKLFDEDSRRSPINNFYFPYVDSNFDEAYWTNSFTIYTSGHDNNSADDDWQGSNALVGDAHVMWMSDDFDRANMSPRSTNDPRFTMLVNGTVIPDKKDNDVPVRDTELPPQDVADGFDENTDWQSRFVKHSGLGQALIEQDSTTWTCTSDLAYKSMYPNTQILWQRINKDAPLKDYAQAVEYAKQVNTSAICGQTNWRLPTENELKSLLLNTSGSPFYENLRASYITSVFDDTNLADSSYYWTSTISSKTQHSAFAFQDSWSVSSPTLNTKMHRVRLISTTRLQP